MRRKYTSALHSPQNRAKLLTAIATALFAIQAAAIAIPSFLALPARESTLVGEFPSRLLTQREQWDWEVLRRACQDRGLMHPDIQYLGNGPVYCPTSISYPWLRRNEQVRVTWLWRYEEGEIHWNRIRTKLDEADVVITVLNYRGLTTDKQPLDNAHNDQLAALLAQDPRFEGPVEIDVGTPSPAQILVFFHLRRTPAPPSPSP